MGEDVPLTEFDSGEDSGDDDDERGDTADDSDPASSEQVESVGEPTETADESAQPADEPAEGDAAETPSLTYTSSPDGAPCAACGETVEKRWRAGEGGVTADDSRDGVDDPDALVCPDCKEW